jgi:flagellin-like hook-associated protein FlgL
MPSIPTFLSATNFQTRFSALSERMYDLQQQTASGYKSENLKGYGANAARLIDARSMIADNESRIAAAERLNARLTMQDVSLSQIGKATSDLRDAMSTAIVTGKLADLSTRLDLAFVQAISGMNNTHENEPMFAGDRRDETTPVALHDLRQLAAASDISTIYRTGARDQTADLGGGVFVTVAERADTISTELFTAIRDIYNLIDGVSPTAELSEQQKQDLRDLDQNLASAHTTILGAQSRNGVNLNRIEKDIDRLKSNNTTIGGYMSDIADADLAEVSIKLSATKAQYEASAQVYNQLREMTLVNFLR